MIKLSAMPQIKTAKPPPTDFHRLSLKFPPSNERFGLMSCSALILLSGPSIGSRFDGHVHDANNSEKPLRVHPQGLVASNYGSRRMGLQTKCNVAITEECPK